MNDIEAIKQIVKETCEACYGSNSNENWRCDICGYKKAISALEKQLNNGWISVKERLPKDDICIPTYVTIRHKETGYIFTARMRWFFGKFEYYNGKTLSSIYEITAWKHEELPQPFKEGEE